MNDHPELAVGSARPAAARWRLVLAVAPEAGDSTRQLRQAAWDTALRGCGLPLAGLDADPPKPRQAAAAPLSGGIAGEAELTDLWLVERMPRWKVRETLEAIMPPGLRLLDVYDVWLGEPPLPGRVVASVYRVELVLGEADAVALHAAVEAMLEASSLRRERAKGAGTVAYDLRPFLAGLEVLELLEPTGHETGRLAGRAWLALRMTLRHDPERGIGRPDEVLAEIGDRMGAPLTARAVVREQLVLGDARPVPAPPPRRAGPRPTSRRWPTTRPTSRR